MRGLLRSLLRRLGCKSFSLSDYDYFISLTRLFPSDKWETHGYTDPYFRHFSSLRHSPIRLLEIGVGGYESAERGYSNPRLGGESLRFWKAYFSKGSIFAIDIEDKTQLQEDRICIFQGSQADAAFLNQVLRRIGELDVIIDDGSHINEHVIFTFNLLFPRLKMGGLYVIEDTQTSYWPGDYGGDATNRNNVSTIMGFFKSLVDGLNHAEFPDPVYQPSWFDQHIKAISFFHNLIFIEKGRNDRPSNMIRRGESIML